MSKVKVVAKENRAVKYEGTIYRPYETFEVEEGEVLDFLIEDGAVQVLDEKPKKQKTKKTKPVKEKEEEKVNDETPETDESEEGEEGIDLEDLSIEELKSFAKENTDMTPQRITAFKNREKLMDAIEESLNQEDK
ncbi:MAG: hypothetical protein WEB94_00720 [Candidatus Paceibacterota bacterium]